MGADWIQATWRGYRGWVYAPDWENPIATSTGRKVAFMVDEVVSLTEEKVRCIVGTEEASDDEAWSGDILSVLVDEIMTM